MKGKTYKLVHPRYATAVLFSDAGPVILTRKDGNPHRYVQDPVEAERLAGKFVDYHASRPQQHDDAWNQMVEFPAEQMAKIRERSAAFYTAAQDAADRGEEVPDPPKASAEPARARAEDEADRRKAEERERVQAELRERRAAAERKAKEEEDARRQREQDEQDARDREELERLRGEQDGVRE